MHDDRDDQEELLYLKYAFDGLEDVERLAEGLCAMGRRLSARAAAGWALVAPVDGGWVHLRQGGK